MKFVILKRKSLVAVICIVVLTTMLSVGVFSVAGAAVKTEYIIVIDAGHGGIDGGCIGIKTKVKESEINLAIANRVKKRFEELGVKVVMTRTNENSLTNSKSKFKQEDMKARKKIIENTVPDLVISVHANKYSSTSRRGAQTFFAKNSEGKCVASFMQKSLNDNVNSYYSNRDYSELAGDYFILKCTSFPTILVECGFLSNPEDEKLLISEEYQEAIARAISMGALSYLVNANKSTISI